VLSGEILTAVVGGKDSAGLRLVGITVIIAALVTILSLS